jgi:hypothetical protein
VVLSIRRGDWPDVLDACAARPGAVERDPRIELNLALAEAITGQRPLAEERLDALRASLPLAGVNLAVLLLVRDPARSLALGEEAEAGLPGDAMPIAVQARALVRLGRTAEARDAIDRAQALTAPDGSLCAIGVEAALGEGDLDMARIELALAKGLTPGLAYVRYVAARFAVRARDPDAAEQVAAARDAVAATPLAFLDEQLAELEAELTAAGPDGVESPEPAP